MISYSRGSKGTTNGAGPFGIFAEHSRVFGAKFGRWRLSWNIDLCTPVTCMSMESEKSEQVTFLQLQDGNRPKSGVCLFFQLTRHQVLRMHLVLTIGLNWITLIGSATLATNR